MTLILALALNAQAPTVSMEALVREMTDLRALARRSSPWYDYRQASSYDRASDEWKEPFANADFGKFLRTEEREGRREEVMADLKGPGAVVRVWSANPTGTIRFYFDGEEKPRLEADMNELLSGKHPLFPEPFAYVAAQGKNLYFPLPYSRSLKVTWDNGGRPLLPGLYYVIGHRTYEAGTRVQSFTAESIQKSAAAIREAAQALGSSPAAPGTVVRGTPRPLPPGAITQLRTTSAGGAEVREFRAIHGAKDDPKKPWTHPSRLHNVLRRLRLRMGFDGATTVDVPLGDFFGSSPGLTPYKSLPLEVRADGAMISRWVMPYRSEARIWVVNENPIPVPREISEDGERSLRRGHLSLPRAVERRRSRRSPGTTSPFLDAKGEGKFVAAHLQVTNLVPEWWGEGDEKAYVDGETFPSLFGTGTEDYYGYAWSDPTPFERPYHAQPPTANFGNFGQTNNLRFHVLDPIPFRRSIRFDMEAWHWRPSVTTFATTALWYALPVGRFRAA